MKIGSVKIPRLAKTQYADVISIIVIPNAPKISAGFAGSIGVVIPIFLDSSIVRTIPSLYPSVVSGVSQAAFAVGTLMDFLRIFRIETGPLYILL